MLAPKRIRVSFSFLWDPTKVATKTKPKPNFVIDRKFAVAGHTAAAAAAAAQQQQQQQQQPQQQQRCLIVKSNSRGKPSS